MNELDTVRGLHAQLACLWEATARKPGNVHRFRDFDDTTYLDFAVSAAAAAPALAVAPYQPVGLTVSDAVGRTCQVARRNTNLGIVLLLAPLARAAEYPDYRGNLERVLEGLTVEDAALAYLAIQRANPGGLGHVAEQDVRDPPTVTLRQAMALAAGRDLVARQYANGFREVFDDGVPALLTGLERTGCVEGAIIHAQLHLMSRHPDTLISRKRGEAEAFEAAERARRVLGLGWPQTHMGIEAIRELDSWLRAEGHARNPGTTADLVAACLFVLLRSQRLPLPLEVPWPLASHLV